MARAFSASDAQGNYSDAVRNELQLSFQERIRLRMIDQRRKRGSKVEQLKKIKIRIGALNVDTKTRSKSELVD